MRREFCSLIERLDAVGGDDQAVRRAIKLSSDHLDKAAQALGRLTDPDTSVVVFGSLARGEAVDASDVDWTLLIDGQTKTEHQQVALEVRQRFQDLQMNDPRAGGAFGHMASSHEIVHRIGGQYDTNKNLTQRMLLLLESTSAAGTVARDRVIKLVLQRYVLDETSFLTDAGKKYRVPRFLLNDIVRFWRTMAVDYASKRFERGDEGWALRNAKLRFSRKLLFAAGLTMCLSAKASPSAALNEAKSDEDIEAALVEHLDEYRDRTPLEVVLKCFEDYAGSEWAARFISSYNTFISVVSDNDKRERLKHLDASKAANDAIFSEVRKASHEYQECLNALFLNGGNELSDLTRKYGVF